MKIGGDETSVNRIYETAIDEIRDVFRRIDDAQVDECVRMIASANKVVVFGGGREGL